MESVDSGPVPAKRKRSSAEPVPMPRQAPLSTSNQTMPINYLLDRREDKMMLVSSDIDSFNQVNGLLDEYEGVLRRHESFAASFGAKLMAPLLLKSLEKLFEGPIVVIEGGFAASETPTWVEIVETARAKPGSLTLEFRDGIRVCRMWVKNCRVEISEDDYRLLLSGAPERMLPPMPIAEDEASELGTIDILEQRLNAIIKKADMIASRGRQFNYQLRKRKGAILEHQGRAALGDQNSSSTSSVSMFSHHATNGETSSGLAIQQDLLRQFSTPTRQSPVSVGSNNHVSRPKASGTSHHTANSQSLTRPHHNSRVGQSPDRGSPSGSGTGMGVDSVASPSTSRATARKVVEDHNRTLIIPMMEKLARGDVISPPCDRCRRLSIPCTKHQTACSGCTKKHARCMWKDTSDEEIASLAGNMGQLQPQPSSAEIEGSEKEKETSGIGNHSRPGSTESAVAATVGARSGISQSSAAVVNPMSVAVATAAVDDARRLEESERVNESRGEHAHPREGDMP